MLVFVFLIFLNMLNLIFVAEPLVKMISVIISDIPSMVQAGLVLQLS